MNIIKLTGAHSDEPIFVNLRNVTFYHYDSSPSGESKYTQIYFGSDDHWLRVKETPEEIQKIIKDQEPENYIPLEDYAGVAERKAKFWAKAIENTSSWKE